MRIGGKTAAGAHVESDFALVLACGEGQIVDLRNRAPGAAAGDGDLELARQVVEVRAADEQFGRCACERRRVDQLRGIDSRQRAGGDVARVVAAGALGGQPGAPQFVENARQILQPDPVQLDVLADRDVGHAAGALLGDAGDGAQLPGRDLPGGQTDAQHQVRRGGAAHRSHAVALRVDAPPAQVGAHPLGRRLLDAARREGAQFVERFPRILLPLQALDALGCAFPDFGGHKTRRPARGAAGLIPPSSL